MRLQNKFILILLGIFVFTVLNSSLISAGNTLLLHTCGNISAAGNYSMNKSITLHNGTHSCINIKASNVNLNCNSSALNYTGTTPTWYGIHIRNTYKNITIRGCKLYNWKIGIYADNNSNITIYNNTILSRASSVKYGIYINKSLSLNITKNNITTTANYGYGIYLNNSNTTLGVRSNNISTNGSYAYGLYLYKALRIKIDRNNVTTFGNYGYGIYFLRSPAGAINANISKRYNSTNITKNNITTKGNYSYGLFLNSSNNSIVIRNIINTSGNYSYGAYIFKSTKNNFTWNNITTKRGYAYGVYARLSNITNITQTNITTRGEYAYGIFLSSSNLSQVHSNDIRTLRNYGYGIYAGPSNNTKFDRNNITTFGNYSYGYYSALSSSMLRIRNTTILTTGNYSTGIYFDTSWMNNVTIATINTTKAYAVYIALTNNMKYFNHSVKTATERGKTIYYVFNNKTSGDIMSKKSIGQLIVANSSNLTFTKISMNHSDGVIFVRTYNITLNQSNITTKPTAIHGVYLYYANNTKIRNNNITTLGQDSYGLYVYQSGNKMGSIAGKTVAGKIKNITNVSKNNFNVSRAKLIYVTDLLNKTIYYNHTFYNNTGWAGTVAKKLPIYYLYGNNTRSIAKGKIENKTVSQIILAFTGNVSIRNISMPNSRGIQLIKAHNTSISKTRINMSNIYSNAYGIHLINGTKNNISKSRIRTNGTYGYGIYLHGDARTGFIEYTNVTTTGTYGYGLTLVKSSNNTVRGNRIRVESTTSGYVVYFSGKTLNNIIKNNYLNGSTAGTNVYIGTDLSNTWYGAITHVPTTKNIVGQEYLGGNYWTNKSKNGHSDSCTDANGDYICDIFYNMTAKTNTAASNNSDLYPLGNSTTYTAAAATPGGGGPAASEEAWTKTFVPSESELATGYTQQFSSKERAKVSVAGVSHTVGIMSITATTATINISSTAQQATLNIGDEKKFDVNSDNIYDLDIKLNSITSNKASLTIKTISEAIPAAAEEEKAPSAGEEITQAIEKISWTWIIVIIVIVVIIIVVFVIKKKR